LLSERDCRERDKAHFLTVLHFGGFPACFELLATLPQRSRFLLETQVPQTHF
jgi:hypothetical protein